MNVAAEKKCNLKEIPSNIKVHTRPQSLQHYYKIHQHRALLQGIRKIFSLTEEKQIKEINKYIFTVTRMG